MYGSQMSNQTKNNNLNNFIDPSELNRLSQQKTPIKNHTGVTLRINIKMFNGNNLPHELLLTTRQKKK